MYETLWAGVEFKVGSAEFFLAEMGRVMAPPRQPLGGAASHRWQPDLYYFLDAFLQATRSVPDVIQWNFGVDPHGVFKTWFNSLAGSEPQRRSTFQTAFLPLLCPFRTLPLTVARNISVHRMGTPPVEVRFSGRWGCYSAGPAAVLPAAESSADSPTPLLTQGDPAMEWAATLSPVPLVPSGGDFTFSVPQAAGPPLTLDLIPGCRDYLAEARRLVEQARQLVNAHHAGGPLTTPPLS